MTTHRIFQIEDDRIGRRLAELLRPFEVRLLASDRARTLLQVMAQASPYRMF